MDGSVKRRGKLSYVMLASAIAATCGGITWAMPWTTASPPLARAHPSGESASGYPLTLDQQSQVVDAGSPRELQPPASPPGPGPATGSNGIPATVLDAYRRAAARAALLDPGCHLPWQLLAAIGKVESGHAEGGAVDASGRALRPILGPALDGTHDTAAITDPGGSWARAMGPMQFIPSTWAKWGVDVLGTGTPDPENVYDATAAAADYLCANGDDLSTPDGLRVAVLSYNHSERYLSTVLDWYRLYSGGAVTVPDQAPGADLQAPGSDLQSAGAGPQAAGSDLQDAARTNPPAATTSGQPTPTPPPPPSASASGAPVPAQTATPPPTPDPITGLNAGLATVVNGVLGHVALPGLLPH